MNVISIFLVRNIAKVASERLAGEISPNWDT
jgi:hypothetical protein